MKKVIVSGANGFIGGALVRELLRHEYEVYALDREGCSDNLSQGERVHFVPCELSEMASLKEKLPHQRYHAFYHFAWAGSAGPARADTRLQLNNAQWTVDSLRAAKELGCARFLCAGSIMEHETMAAAYTQGNRPGMGYIYGGGKLIAHVMCMSVAADAIGGIDTAAAFHILHMDKRWQTGTIRAYFYPGCGYGGYCLPKDTNAFYARTKDSGFDGQILKNTILINDEMPEVTAKRIIQAAGKNKETCIGILGLSFNPGSDDVRDTPSAKIIRALNEAGYQNILAYDPVAMEEFRTHYHLDCRYANTYDELLRQAGTVAITTAWPMFKDVKSRTNSPVVDCRFML